MIILSTLEKKSCYILVLTQTVILSESWYTPQLFQVDHSFEPHTFFFDTPSNSLDSKFAVILPNIFVPLDHDIMLLLFVSVAVNASSMI